MTVKTIEKVHPLPGGIYDDTNASSRANNDAGVLPDFSQYGPSAGKLPSAGSFIGFCFYGEINKAMPGYAVMRIKGVATKVRILLTDHPDGG